MSKLVVKNPLAGKRVNVYVFQLYLAVSVEFHFNPKLHVKKMLD